MKRLFLLLALCGMVAVGCTEGGIDDNINNGGGNNTEQPGGENEDENSIFITDSEGNIVVEAEGGEVLITVTTNLEYSVEIPEDAKSWLSVADTRAVRMEKLTFTVAANETFEERSATVELKDADGKVLQSVSFKQKGVEEVFDTDSEGNYIVEADGGTVAVKVTTNLEYDVIIPNEALAWISLAGTRAVREETLTMIVAKNEGSEERSATVNLCAKGGDILQTITIKQNKPTTISCANNEIIYTTKYGYPIELNTTDGFGGNIMSHNYENGYGRISFDNDVVSIPNEAFNGCTTLTTIVLPNSLSTIDSSAFYGCTSLTSVYITDIAAWCNISFSDSSSNPLCYAGNLYLNNELVTDLIIPDSVTSIGSFAFSGCTSLTSITIGKGVTSIEYYAFYRCTSLESVTIPDSVTSIGKYAFDDCTSLTSITIPDSVTWIDYCAFYNCYSLKEVYCKPTTPPTGDSSMFFNNASGRTIYVPSNSVSAYKSASGWSKYASDIVGYDF